MRNLSLILLFVVQSVYGQYLTSNLDSLLLYGRHNQLINSLKQQPPTEETVHQLARVYYDKLAYYDALRYYKKAAEYDKKLMYRLRIAELNAKLGFVQKAEDQLNQLVVELPENNGIRFRLAKLLYQQAKFNKAIEVFETLIESDRNNTDYLYGLGLIHSSKKNHDSAITTYLKVVKKDSIHFNSMYQLAKSFQSLRIVDSTYLYVDKGLSLRPDHKNLSRVYINQLRRENKLSKAIGVLKRQDSLYPNEFYNKKSLGICYYNLEDYALAQNYFEAAVDLDPLDYKSYTYLGHVGLKKGKHKEAFFHYLKATLIGKEKRDEEFYGAAMASIALGSLNDAQTYLKRAYQENRRNPKVIFELAKIIDHNVREKKQAYTYFMDYVIKFPRDNKANIEYANQRIKEIKEAYFLAGKSLD